MVPTCVSHWEVSETLGEKRKKETLGNSKEGENSGFLSTGIPAPVDGEEAAAWGFLRHMPCVS